MDFLFGPLILATIRVPTLGPVRDEPDVQAERQPWGRARSSRGVRFAPPGLDFVPAFSSLSSNPAISRPFGVSTYPQKKKKKQKEKNQ
jgi:hypothetical protein